MSQSLNINGSIYEVDVEADHHFYGSCAMSWECTVPSLAAAWRSAVLVRFSWTGRPYVRV